MKQKWILALAVAFVLAGCSTSPPTRLSDAEDLFDTGGPIRRLYHASLYYPVEIAPRYDGYLLGVEKTWTELIMEEGDLHLQAIPDASFTMDKLREKMRDRSLLYVSHVLKTFSNQTPDNKNCALYNAYAYDAAALEKQLVVPCEGQPPVFQTVTVANDGGLRTAKSTYKNSWTAMDSLGKDIAERAPHYSAVLVVVLGWNTPQEQAVRNVNSIVMNLKSARGNDFNPLVIAVTWPSQWNSAWLDFAYKAFSFNTKAYDADELGYTWLGVLLHRTLPQHATGKDVIVIGHSFGARATSVASCIGPAIYDKVPDSHRAAIHTLVNFQGAYDAGRAFGEPDKGINFPKGCENVARFVLTASEGDTANSLPFWADYAGTSRAYVAQCAQESTLANCACSDKDGNLTVSKKGKYPKVWYVDATRLVSENAYDTGGGSHNDIFRVEHGRLVSNAIDRKQDVGECKMPKSKNWLQSVM
nr:alpha/beta hydrolase [uncultured Albidiferax sp.]